MQISNTQIFNLMNVNRLNCAGGLKNTPKFNVNFTGSDTFVRSEENSPKEIPSNVRRYLGDDIKYLDKAKEILDNEVFKFKIDDDEFEGQRPVHDPHPLRPKRRRLSGR